MGSALDIKITMIIKTVLKSLRLVDKIILGLKYTVYVKVFRKIHDTN